MTPDPAVIGIGNPFRRDDGVGWAVLDVVGKASLSADLVYLDGETGRLIETWAGRPLVVVVDSVRSGRRAGTIHRLEVPLDTGTRVALGGPASTHGLGLDEAIALSSVMGRLPERLLLVGIEGSDFGEGTGLSTEVASAVSSAAERVRREIGLDAVSGPR